MHTPLRTGGRYSWGICLALALAACGGGSDGTAPDPPNPAPPPPATGGLDARPPNASCLAPPRESAMADLIVTRAFPALTFDAPVGMLQAPLDSTRWFVIEQAGVIRSFPNVDSATGSAVFADLRSRVTSGGEAGLLGMAFHPRHPADPRVFVSYTTGGGSLVSRISMFHTTAGGTTLDTASEQILITVAQPQSNHNGGHIAFGPDGHLYIGLGDGGGGGDQHGGTGNGQNLATLLGKILRIDVDTSPPPGAGYAIPADNPYPAGASCAAGGTGASGARCAEIYAYGLRNPWRFSFDRVNGALWVADVGQGAWEEIDRVTAGGNYGWRCREGAHTFNGNCGGATDLIDPVAEYAHTEGSSVTGGHVYRGTAHPQLVGRYVFGDFGSGRLWSIASDAMPTQTLTGGAASGLALSAFGEGNDGELYAIDYGGGLHRVGLAGATAGGVPALLSQTGCATSGAPATPVAGMIPYAPAAPFWSDGATKERYLALPDAGIGVAADGDFDLPTRTVLVKHFRLGSRLVETRLFMRHPDGVWAGYSYEWNPAGTEATRVVGGKTAVIDGQTWVFPGEGQCLQCHTGAAGYALGLEIAQLNLPLTYPATGRTANQLTTLNAIGLLSPALTQDPQNLPHLADPYAGAGTLTERARSYLHTNCAQCHRPGGGAPDDMDLRHATPLAQTNLCAAPTAGDLGIAGARRLAPGSAATSLIVARMNRRGTGQMPPLASTVVDAAGVALLGDWIAGLPSCD
jgi:uncharacterized repeat protein (TIGR03806 family)